LISDSVEKVENGSRLVDQAGATMEEIVSSVKRVTDIMGEIASASQEQSTGIGQINQAVNQMDEMTQQNAALVEEAAAAAAALEGQATQLSQVINVFHVSDPEAISGLPALSDIEPSTIVQQNSGAELSSSAIPGQRRLRSISC
jgi:methyl-accepting chemotaxis protein